MKNTFTLVGALLIASASSNVALGSEISTVVSVVAGPTLPSAVSTAVEDMYEGYDVKSFTYNEASDVYEIQLSDGEDEFVVHIDSEGNLMDDEDMEESDE